MMGGFVLFLGTLLMSVSVEDDHPVLFVIGVIAMYVGIRRMIQDSD